MPKTRRHRGDVHRLPVGRVRVPTEGREPLAQGAQREAELRVDREGAKGPGYSRRVTAFDATQEPVSEARALEAMTRYCITKLKCRRRSAHQVARAFLDHESATRVALVDPLTNRRLPVHQFMCHTEIGLQDAIKRLGLVYQ
ncbi:MAG: hypothetical protein SGPRY_003077 [Prymnesium sp.]